MKNNWIKAGIAGAVCVAGLVMGCNQPPEDKAPAQGPAVTARIETLTAVSLPVFAVQPGTVVSANRVQVASRLSGYIDHLDVHAGQQVTKGQPLFSVDPIGVKESIRQAKAELAKAEAALAEARSNYERYRKLYQEQSATQTAYEQAERGFKVARGDAQAARAGLRNARAQLKYAEVKAPFAGLVISKLADNGQLASPGTVVLVLENPLHLQVQVQVDDQSYAHLAPDQEVAVEVSRPGMAMDTVTGRVEHMVAAADPVTHTHLVKVGLPAGDEDLSGRFALVRIQVGAQAGIVVPEEAIHHRAGITGVFVVNARNQAQFRMVTPGEKLSAGRSILSGLFSGDRLILSAGGTLANGIPIQTATEKQQ